MCEPATRIVEFVDGTLAVRDHGGAGPTVLFVHALGMCALNWDRVAAPLRETCRVLALDLPGHGRSTATMRTPFSVYECVLAVMRELDLAPALVVGHDHGSLIVAEAVTAAPDLFTGGVAIGGSIAHTPEEMRLMCDVAASDFFVASMRERFGFGARGQGRASAQQLIDDVAAGAAQDWLLRDIEGLRDEREYSMRWSADGAWASQPDPEDIAMVGRFPSTSPYFPTLELIPGYRVPVWIVQLGHGQDAQLAERERDLAARHDALRLVTLDSGQWPQYTRPYVLARLIGQIAHDPTADPASWDDPDYPAPQGA